METLQQIFTLLQQIETKGNSTLLMAQALSLVGYALQEKQQSTAKEGADD